jgi:signal transduction histidine kinase
MARKLIVPALEQGIIWLVLGVLFFYSYAHFVVRPYAGFAFSGSSVTAVYESGPSAATLQVGDELLRVGPVSWTDFAADLRQPLFEGVAAGEVVPLLVRRNGRVLLIPWHFPGFTYRQLQQRLLSSWWLAYLFWALAAVTYLLVRPKGTRWRLLVAFNLLTAVWLAAGSGPSAWHVWHGALVLRSAIWLCLPLYWHLHWLFPEPLARLPAGVVAGAYLAGGALALGQWFQLLPNSAYLVAFLLAVGGSSGLLLAHALFRPEQRRELRLLLQVVSLAAVPLLAAVIAGLGGGDLRLAALALLALPFLPGAYIYVIYRRQAGQMQVRANRLIVLYSYLLLVGTLAATAVSLAANVLALAETLFWIVPAVVLAAAFTVVVYRPYARFVERSILNAPLPPGELLKQYALHIAARPDRGSLLRILTEEILPSLMVRQSALLVLDEKQELAPLLSVNVAAAELPAPADLLPYLANGRPQPFSDGRDLRARPEWDWVRLALPLNVGPKNVGVWLLGRRDPDDVYSREEIPALAALAAQTAVSLTNLALTENLQTLVRANIDRQEQERMRLARDLHDQVLGEVASLTLYADKVAPQFSERVSVLSERLRAAIYDLRPLMLNYGLWPALDSLVNKLNVHAGEETEIYLNVSGREERYPLRVEQHLYRIVQQAIDNALKHASAAIIEISGELSPAEIRLEVADNGMGFPAEQAADLAALLAHHHFGLVGMMERAWLVGAETTIEAVAGRGVRVTVRWDSGHYAAVKTAGHWQEEFS